VRELTGPIASAFQTPRGSGGPFSGGTYVAHAKQLEVLEGEADEADIMVVIRFPDRDAALVFYNDLSLYPRELWVLRSERLAGCWRKELGLTALRGPKRGVYPFAQAKPVSRDTREIGLGADAVEQDVHGEPFDHEVIEGGGKSARP
jgi:hypothetical protein